MYRQLLKLQFSVSIVEVDIDGWKLLKSTLYCNGGGNAATDHSPIETLSTITKCGEMSQAELVHEETEVRPAR